MDQIQQGEEDSHQWSIGYFVVGRSFEKNQVGLGPIFNTEDPNSTIEIQSEYQFAGQSELG